jgi:hypothetical protein
MAFILVLTLHKSKAYSFDVCQIVVLQVQSKVRKGMSAMQVLHGECQIFVKFYSLFRHAPVAVVAFNS